MSKGKAGGVLEELLKLHHLLPTFYHLLCSCFCWWWAGVIRGKMMLWDTGRFESKGKAGGKLLKLQLLEPFTASTISCFLFLLLMMGGCYQRSDDVMRYRQINFQNPALMKLFTQFCIRFHDWLEAKQIALSNHTGTHSTGEERWAVKIAAHQLSSSLYHLISSGSCWWWGLNIEDDDELSKKKGELKWAVKMVAHGQTCKTRLMGQTCLLTPS